MIEHAITLLLFAALAAGAVMAALWLTQHFGVANAAVVDVGWGLNLAIAAGIYASYGIGAPARRWIVAAMVLAWGLRLSWHLFSDRIWRKPEEGRYVQLRREWQTNVPLKFFLFYEFQAALGVLLSVAFLIPAMNPAPQISGLEWFAAALWLVAFAGEWLADAQLAAFKRGPDNRGRVCRTGLWKYSRHPNYFFEWLVWVAFALLASASPWGWTAALGPALMLYFLFKVTGIPATEAQALRSRGDEYRAYQRDTSAFVPWFPVRS